MTEKRPMVILTGPTAVGKTALSIELAKKINGSIISADSMQVYRHMDIGSAKVMPEEMDGIRHYLIDEFEPDEEFHVVKFVERAKEHLEEIYAEGKIPIIAGGTGFYIQALLYDIDFTEQECDEAYRAELEQLAAEKGADYLHNMLREVDPASADAIHANNIKRVIRALEFYHLSGKRISEHNEKEREKTSPYHFAYFVVSMQGLGYKEILDYLDGKTTLEEAIYIIKRETRHFAKRQLTWFRRERDVIWLDKQAYDYQDAKILDSMINTLKDKIILP